ncbi:unnamed protein product [Rotaria sp. Silwood1]|nr:unnamed protein product [Rotaria sp. Silwood1]
MVKGGKVSSLSTAAGKTPAPNTANKGGKPRQQDEKAIDETVKKFTYILFVKKMNKRTSFASGISIKVGPDVPLESTHTFEPLKLDVKGAQTAVVCLRSTEDNVLIRACDSLFKFADKSDGNKLMLHEMGATDTLFTLTHHENPTVQRNATMVFGILAAHRKNFFFIKKKINSFN